MINADKPHLWNGDTRTSVMQYNEWFLNFAPRTYQEARGGCYEEVGSLLEKTDYCRKITPRTILEWPSAIASLRMLCAPPLARDRLAGLADVPSSRIKSLESGGLPRRKNDLARLESDLETVVSIINRLLDRQLLEWLSCDAEPSEDQKLVALSVVADRLCGSTTDPIIRNAQESRQLAAIRSFLVKKGYRLVDEPAVSAFEMKRGTFSFHKNVKMFKNALDDSDGYVNTPVDVVIMPFDTSVEKPLLVECKSAGDFANTNKRRKEEDAKVTQLRATYGDDVVLYLFLCGYFDATYLGYEAANHMDWVWEHRIEDFECAGV